MWLLGRRRRREKKWQVSGGSGLYWAHGEKKELTEDTPRKGRKFCS